MKKTIIILIVVFTIFAFEINAAQYVEYDDSWGIHGFSIESKGTDHIKLNFSMKEYITSEIEINKETLTSIGMKGVFLTNEEGAPNLPTMSRYIAIPEGASVKMNMLDYRKEIIKDINISPAPRIPLETEDGPLEYNKNINIYSKNEYYPNQPVLVSEVRQIRGVDVVIISITPFQYNPVTKEMIVYRDIQINLEFVGGSGQFGEDRLRSRWWDPIYKQSILNYESIPEKDYSYTPSKDDGCDYLIIIPDDDNFIFWANTLKEFRQKQGILTDVVTISDIGGNSTSEIESFVNNAYNNWDQPPVAVLLLADYGTTGNTIKSPKPDNHPSADEYISDNVYADVDGDDLPDIHFARITARNASELEITISKIINYETAPPTNTEFYANPITCCGWQTERWFQLCAEIVGGYWFNSLQKSPIRINEIYSGNPYDGEWSSAANTDEIVNYFGHNGLNYIPDDPATLGGWSGGIASHINTAINNGAFMLLHRDHGSITEWGEPDYDTGDLSDLTNDDLPFVFSIDCLTGKFNSNTECFAEAFHRYEHRALGVIAATETSFSFVNDTYVWGMYDFMWPNFILHYGAGPTDTDWIYPCMGNSAGKIFLEGSSWPNNESTKEVTYYLFHHHGDAFTSVYSEIPQALCVTHYEVILSGSTYLEVTADLGAEICLYANGEIIGTGMGNDYTPTQINIIPQAIGSTITITVTKQNYFRYTNYINVCDYTYIEGTVNISGSGNINEVKIGTGDYITNPDENGIFSLEILPGYYDITAYSSGYEPQTIKNVEVIEGQATTGLDFSLDEGYVIYVQKDGLGDYFNIQEGIDAADDGDIVMVADGTYTGDNNTNLFWNGNEKHLIVRSENGPDNCIIQGTGTDEAFDIDYVETTCLQDMISGFTISNFEVGILFTNSPGITICNNNIVNCDDHGVLIANCDSCIIKFNDFDNCDSYGAEPKGGAIYSDSPGLISYNDIENCTSSNYPICSGEGGGIWATHENMTIRNNTISNCSSNEGGGIYAGQAEVYGNIIKDCSVQGWGGGGISGGENVENNTVRGCSSSVYDDYGGYGGAIIDAAYIRYNLLEENSSRNGGTVTITWQEGAEIIGNEFYNNTMSAGTLIFSGASAIGVECNNVLIKENIIVDGVGYGDGGAVCAGYDVSDIDIINNTIVNNSNEAGIRILQGSANNKIINNVVANNEDYGIWAEGDALVEVTYCDFYSNGFNYLGVFVGDGCIEENPQFDENYSLQWDETHFSPCIDTGHPGAQYEDDDGTPADMGAISADTHDYFKDDYDSEEFDRIDWISFPVLNTITNDYTDALNVLRNQLLIDDDSQTIDSLDHVLYENYPYIKFESGSWQNDLPPEGNFDSKQGYIFVLKEGCDNMPVKGISGTWQDESTPISLLESKDNWIGCYLTEPAYIQDAFESIWDEWTEIRSEHWAICREEWEEMQRCGWTVNPGELYIVEVENDCNLVWNKEGSMPPFTREQTDYFTYVETADYMPILVDTVYSDTTVAEIAVFCEDECLGASKVTDGYPVQILAYTPTVVRSNNGLEFRILYDDGKRNISKSIPYIMYNSDVQAYIDQPLYYQSKNFEKVQLNTSESTFSPTIALNQNYPNPVRSSITTIIFLPDKDAQHTEVTIYNIKGQLVKRINCDEAIVKGMNSGYYSVQWDCCNDHGREVSNGIYFYRLTSGNKNRFQKMLIMK